MTHPLPLLCMNDICKSFAGHQVLHKVSLCLQAGEVCALVGHNGAGKSTLMKVLAGFYRDYTGEITLEGRSLHLTNPQDSLSSGVAVIHQEFSLVPTFTVAENLALGHEPLGALCRLDRRTMYRRAEALLRHIGFDLPIDVPVRKLSVAYQQLTEIAKALSREARVLVMDEPTSRLATAERQKLFATIEQLRRRHVGMIYISHFLEEVLSIADTVSVLRDGHCVHTGATKMMDLPQLSALIVGQTMKVSTTNSHTSPPQEAIKTPSRETAPVLQLRQFGALGRPASNLSMRSGEIVGLAGLVGSGRTTLVEAICGAMPSYGYLALKGSRVHWKSPSDAIDQGIVLVPEDRKHRGLVMTSNTGSNIILTALSRHFSYLGFPRRKAVREAIDQAVTRFGVRGKRVAHQIVRHLSGGNQQKVLLARANAALPTILVLDQPTAGVDIGAKEEMYEHIKALARTGIACLFVSDELDELLTLSDRICIVRDGAISGDIAVADLSSHELLAHMSQTRRES